MYGWNFSSAVYSAVIRLGCSVWHLSWMDFLTSTINSVSFFWFKCEREFHNEHVLCSAYQLRNLCFTYFHYKLPYIQQNFCGVFEFADYATEREKKKCVGSTRSNDRIWCLTRMHFANLQVLCIFAQFLACKNCGCWSNQLDVKDQPVFGQFTGEQCTSNSKCYAFDVFHVDFHIFEWEHWKSIVRCDRQLLSLWYIPATLSKFSKESFCFVYIYL